MSQTAYRVALPGFVEEQWQTFEEEGIVVIEDALTNDEVRQYTEAIDRVAATLPECRDGAYCPAWVTSHDRVLSDPEWLESLHREQRIIMRSYDQAYQNAKPPAADFPLFLDRETGLDRDPDLYREHVVLSRRKRLTAAEKRLVRAAV